MILTDALIQEEDTEYIEWVVVNAVFGTKFILYAIVDADAYEADNEVCGVPEIFVAKI